MALMGIGGGMLPAFGTGGGVGTLVRFGGGAGGGPMIRAFCFEAAPPLALGGGGCAFGLAPAANRGFSVGARF